MIYWRRKSYRSTNQGVVIFWSLFGAVYLAGWVLNIVSLFHLPSILTGEGAVRIAGIFVPFLGPIMGYFF